MAFSRLISQFGFPSFPSALHAELANLCRVICAAARWPEFDSATIQLTLSSRGLLNSCLVPMPPCLSAHVGCAAAAPAIGAYSRADPLDHNSAAHVARQSCMGSFSPRTQGYAGSLGRHVCRLQHSGTLQRRRTHAPAVSSAGIVLQHPDGRTVPMDKVILVSTPTCL
jgi:hypothetical protein